jgi:hypothetical protein
VISKRLPRVGVDHLIIAIAVFVGFISGTRQLSDNSMLLHIRTGLIILHTHHVPHADPYSFTAKGHPWIVESWLPELLYAVMIKVGGGHLLQVFNAVLYGVVAGVIAKLCGTNNLWRSLLTSFVSIGIGYWLWTTRPTMFGLLYFILMVLVVTQRRNAFWLFPIGLLWVNSHASWPLGIAWVVLTGVGARFDGEKVADYSRYAAFLVAGVLLGGLASPAGTHILTFPAVGFGARSSVFQSIAEWKSPNFGSAAIENGRVVLLSVFVAILVLARRCLKWSELLAVIMLFAAALLGLRNLSFLGAGMAPVLARTLASPEGVVDAGLRRILTFGVAAFVLCSALDLVATYQKSPYNFQGYPVAAVNWLDARNLIGPGHRIAAPDVVGCYLIYKYGAGANDFIDDRYDMYPVNVENDSLNLGRVTQQTRQVLDRYQFQALLFGSNSALSTYISADPAWHMVYQDKRWKIFEPTAGSIDPGKST